MYTSKLVPLLTLINIVFASQCPSLTYVEYSGVKAIAALNRPYIADTLTRHDLNVQGINQTFPPGTFVIDSRDNSQLTIFEDECLVLSSWGGYRDAARSLPINNDTKISSFSLGKIPISLGLIWLHDQERFQYDQPMSVYWPAYGNAGKALLTVEQTFGNFDGAPYIPFVNLSVVELGSDTGLLRTLIENSPPAYGSDSDPNKGSFGYDPVVWAWVANFFSTFVDIKNRTIVQVIQEEIANKTDSKIYYGISPNDTEGNTNVADIQFGSFAPTPCQDRIALASNLLDTCSLQYRAIFNPVGLFDSPLVVNTEAGRNVLVPGGVVFTSSYDLAKMMVPFTMEGKGNIVIASQAAIDMGTDFLFNGTDVNAFYKSSFTRTGLFGNAEGFLFSPNKRGWGHSAAPGSMAFSAKIRGKRVTFVYDTTSYSTGGCNPSMPWNSYSLWYTYNGWPLPSSPFKRSINGRDEFTLKDVCDSSVNTGFLVNCLKV